MKTIFMFAGQGSQYYHMGSKLMESEPVFKKQMLALNEVVRSVHGYSVIDQLYNSTYKLFDPFLSLKITHPAIFMAGYSLAKVLEHYGIRPNYVVGCSLGEFTAAAISGILAPEDALRMIIHQAGTVESRCEKGAMVAVLDSTSSYHHHATINKNSTIAAINSPSQFVIAGESGRLDVVKQFMKQNEILHQDLMVSYGFHSPAIDAAADYVSYAAKQTYKKPTIPFISGTYGKLLSELPADYFWQTVRKPTLFSEAVKCVDDSTGIEEDLMFVDLGTGSLANLIKYNLPRNSRAVAFQIITPFQQEEKKLGEVKKYYHDHKPVITAPPSPKKKSIAYIFPGQGSQKKGMGEGLFDIYPELTDKASDILGYSIRELCVDNPNRNLSLTQYTQPALYVVNALSYLRLKEDSGTVPDFVAGHSLGEYNALFAAGGFDFETGLKLVQKRGALMAKMRDGGMAAVKGLTEEAIKWVITRNGLEDLDVANYNSQNQIVLSGPRELIGNSGPFFESAGATLYFPLNVNGAFHSRYMIPAQKEFEQFLQQFSFSSLNIPVVSNVEGTFYTSDKIRTLLAKQLTHPVRWTESMMFLIEKGEIVFQEVGPGDVLTKLVWRIQQDLQEVIQ